MSHHSPLTISLDGKEWVEREAYDTVKRALMEKQRTTRAHNHQFAEIADMWANLPHIHAGAPYAASAEAFRKHGLIATGHCDVDTIDCESHEIALRVAPVVAKNARKAHGYALTVVRGPLVVCSTPKSQSYKAMGKELFQRSKSDVLNWASEMLGVSA